MKWMQRETARILAGERWRWMGERLGFTLWTPPVWNCWKRISLGERRVLRLCRPAPFRRKIPGLTGVSRFWPEDRSRQATSVRLRALDDSPQMEREGLARYRCTKTTTEITRN